MSETVMCKTKRSLFDKYWDGLGEGIKVDTDLQIWAPDGETRDKRTLTGSLKKLDNIIMLPGLSRVDIVFAANNNNGKWVPVEEFFGTKDIDEIIKCRMDCYKSGQRLILRAANPEEYSHNDVLRKNSISNTYIGMGDFYRGYSRGLAITSCHEDLPVIRNDADGSIIHRATCDFRRMAMSGERIVREYSRVHLLDTTYYRFTDLLSLWTIPHYEEVWVSGSRMMVGEELRSPTMMDKKAGAAAQHNKRSM